MPYALNTLGFVNRPFEPIDYKLAETMSSYWVNFSKYGSPNKKGMPIWKKYDFKSKRIMEFGIEAKAKTIPDAPSLDYFMKIYF